MKKIFFAVIVFAFLFSTLNASTYYVDQENGNNINSGLTPSLAWKTISKVNSTVLLPGDQILFKSGQIWREQLNVPTSGTSLLHIEFNSYGTGNKPIISGADLLTGFTQYSGNVWRKLTTSPKQVYFNEIRGIRKTSASAITSQFDWFYAYGYLYIYSSGNPSNNYNSPGIEASVRNYAAYINKKFISFQNFQVERTASSAILLTSSSEGVTLDNINFIQWTNEENSSKGGAVIQGKNNTLSNSTFGRNTGNDIADQNWAGFLPILLVGTDIQILNNKIYHNSTENENGNGSYAYGIRVWSVSGITKISGNSVYHTGGNGIFVGSNSKKGDKIYIHDNTIEYPGQAGISNYQTRSDDGVGGEGYIYNNHVSFVNRLGGDVGGNGTQGSGIHFNDGLRAGTSLAKPYMKWYCYENIVHNNGALKKPNSPDGCGISMDYNANNVEVYRNLIYNNYGKGIEMWNANNCKISYNIIYGNDAGTTITALRGGTESAINNQIFNNTYYKNYNGPEKGPNLNAEIWFGFNSKNATIVNNIIYSAIEGHAYVYNVENTYGHFLDNNILYAPKTLVVKDGRYGAQTVEKWKINYPAWDQNSINADPLFTDESSKDFSLSLNSPAINKGRNLGSTIDFAGNPIIGMPDIGALEFNETVQVPSSVLLASPLNNSVNPSVEQTLKWNKSNDAENYILQISTDLNFTSIMHNEASLTDTAKTITSLKKGSKYFWRVKAKNNLFESEWTEAWQFSCVDTTTIQSNDSINSTAIMLNAVEGKLSGDARLGSMTGMKNSRAVYFTGTNGGVTFNVDIPKNGTWYAWARMYYMSSGGKNSFFISANGSKQVLGDDDSKYNQWHWDGNLGSKINLGALNAGNQTIIISGREPGLTLWVDQIVLTDDPDFIPAENKLSQPPVPTLLLANANESALSGDARLGTMRGMINTRAVYFKGTNGGASFSIDIPKSGTWYAWARMYYMSSGGKNSFFISANGSKQILGDDDNKYNQWHWDGSLGSKINLGTLNAGKQTIIVSGREPGLTLWVDQIVITDDPDFIPADTKLSSILVPTLLLANANKSVLSGDARLGSITGMINTRAVYFTGTSGGASFNINIPKSGTWYAWARIYYMSSGGKNSFFISANGSKQILGDDDNKYNQWHWDGYKGSKINLGTLNAGEQTITISGREPGLTLWVDQFILTDDPNYNPNSDLSKENDDTETKVVNNVPTEFELSQNYPNPFNPSTTIRYSLADNGHVSLKIYDILGTEIVTLIDEVKPSGYYEVKFEAGNLSSGVYIYQIKTDNFVQTRKMNLLK